MLAGTRAYEKVGQEEEGEYSPSSSSSSSSSRPSHEHEQHYYQRSSRRPLTRFFTIFAKVVVCLFALYGAYCAVLNTAHYVHAPPEQHDHHHHHDGEHAAATTAPAAAATSHAATPHNANVADHVAALPASSKDVSPHPSLSSSSSSPERPVLYPDGYAKYADWKPCSCGKSVDEALAMGCKFDSHALAWLPPHCRDDELTAEFETLGTRPDGSWELYADAEGTQPLNFSDISMKPGTKFYMTMEWHDMHCAYTWRKLYRSRALGITMDRKSDGLGHIGHCTGEFLRRAPLQALTTKATIDLDAENPEKED